MNDAELAEALVERGIGERWVMFNTYELPGATIELPGATFEQSKQAEHFVRDWRVAGACMEEGNYHRLSRILKIIDRPLLHVSARAICMAFVEAKT